MTLPLNYFKLQIYFCIYFVCIFSLNCLTSIQTKALLSFLSFFSRILIDAGEKNVKEYQDNLSKVLKQEQVNIEHIIVTHWHNDHIGGVENLYGSIASKILSPSIGLLLD